MCMSMASWLALRGTLASPACTPSMKMMATCLWAAGGIVARSSLRAVVMEGEDGEVDMVVMVVGLR